MVKIFRNEVNEVPAGFQLVSFTRKTTKQNPVADADKFRGCFVPVFPEMENVAAVVMPLNSVFLTAIQEAVDYAASEILKAYCTEKPAAEEIDESLLTLNAVLAKMQEQQSSQRLNGEQIERWFDASKTKDFCIENYKADAKKMELVRSKYASLASNNPSLKPTEMQKLLAFIQEGDLQHPVAKAIAKKLDRMQQEIIKDDEL